MKSGEDYEALLAEQRARLQRIREQGTSASEPRTGGQEFAATAGDGAVRVVVRDRRLVTVEIAPRLIGGSRREVSEVLREAINQALARSLAESPQVGDPTPDLGSLGDQLSEFARRGAEELRRIQGAVERNMAELAGKVQISGDASPQYVDFLYEDALEVVRSMQSALADSPSEPAVGEGWDESEEVEAVVSQGELTELALTGFALQMPPGELGGAVSEAVNDALIEWEERSAATANRGVDVEALRKLGERADAVRAQSMQHLRNYTDSMTSIMRNAE
ncbi:hypothetical protein OU415_08915 [Saccharopolyspora sp. WRP15-2]|uniref:YbaB/EbfC DNA-binding family protein n=1 Tax=Saccharopolyspora oryzae TaxID=2997343 RepID=A0ABT4UV16_9PSEU|nr:hypothetical protein [Saccharopolyspora oryzae]MDA3625556.1 hypothetical protein [Saccharopolyspora oryzae]